MVLRPAAALATLASAALLAAACAQPAAAPGTPAAATTPAPAAQPATPAAATPGPTAPPKAAVPTGNVRMAITALPSNLDPTVAINTTTGAEVGFAIAEPLVEVARDGSITGLLAESWSVSGDGTVWTFRIRQGARFSDGTPVTAQDARFSLDLVKDPANRYSNAGRLATIASMATPDPATLAITTTTRDAIFPRRVTGVAIVPEAAWNRLGAERFRENPVTAGQYKVRTIEQGQRIVLEANPNSWRPPRVATIEFRGLGEAITRVTALQTQEVDISNQIQPALAAGIRNAPGITLRNTPTNATTNIILDSASPDASPLLQDRRVRQALTIGLDRQAIVGALTEGFGQVANQAINPAVFGFNPALPAIPYQPDEARRLIQEAGAAGATLPIGGVFAVGGALTNTTAVQAIAENYSRIGLRLEISPSPDVASFQQKFAITGGLEPLLLFNLTALASDADGALSNLTTVNRTGPIRYRNPEFDRLYAESLAEVNAERRRTILQQAVKVLHDDFAIVPVGYLPVIFGHGNRVDNVDNILGFRFVWSDITVRP